MKRLGNRIWREDQGILTFEWILILTLLVIGIIGAASAVRDALSIELIDVAGAAITLDQSYKVEASKKYGLGTAFDYQQPQSSLCVDRRDGTTPRPPACVGQ